MSTPAIKHGTFSLERTFHASPARTFAAWADPELKARWFVGPRDRWTLLKRELDFRVGGNELAHGAFQGGPESIFAARYHVIEPAQRLVYAYDMTVGGKHLSVSLASVEFAPTASAGTRMTFTEHVAFLNDDYDLASREQGTSALLENLGGVAEDPHEMVSARLFDQPRERLFEAFRDPRQLARWWGPAGFRNTVQALELRPGGAFRVVMHAPDGTDYANQWRFDAVETPERIVLQHIEPVHSFQLTLRFVALGAQTLLVWRMRFDARAEAERVRALVEPANEQNLDRLAAHLAGAEPG
jgi:uncharacterized protein YndB with AHSA1/START domain